MEKQKVKVGLEHFKINMSTTMLTCMQLIINKKCNHCRPKQWTKLNFEKK